MTIADGSGLLPGNKVSPKATARYLISVAKKNDLAASMILFPGPAWKEQPRDRHVKGSALRNEHFRVIISNLE